MLKWIRVVLGVLILSSSISEGQVSGIFLGLFFTLFALFTDGVCCGGGTCYTPPAGKSETALKTIENIEYEELDRK